MADSRRPGPIDERHAAWIRAADFDGARQVQGGFELPGPVGVGGSERHDLGGGPAWRRSSGSSAFAPLERRFAGRVGLGTGIRRSAADVSPGKPGKGRIPHRRAPAQTVALQGIAAPGQPKMIELEVAAAAAYQRLVEEARAAGFAEPLFLVISGYRSRARQAQLYAQALEKYKSEAEARKWVAPPGKSAHETGCAVDLWLGFSCTRENNARIKATEAYAWMVEHAGAHGFNPYEREGWHWEYYVGD